MAPPTPGTAKVIDATELDALLGELTRRGYRTIGPRVRNGAIVLAPIDSSADLPRGYHDEHAPGHYRLHHDEADAELFGWAVGPQSPKRELFPPDEPLFRARAVESGVEVEPTGPPPAPVALFGVRPCELAGISVLDRVFLDGAHVDDGYARRRRDAFVVVAECAAPGGTCFCSSMSTGPDARGPFDLALFELGAGAPDATSTPGGAPGGHRFVVRVGSEAGAAVLARVASREASAPEIAARDAGLAGAAGRMGRALETEGLGALLARNLAHPRWAEVADRCLSCGNCTLVCPTCFCSDVDDVSDLSGALERRRSWASCFDLDHSYLHGGPVRSSVAARYRQWATHKLGTWQDQFGVSGCVGCGRCITWCPVGIDLTEEAAAIRQSDGARAVGIGGNRG